MSRIEILKNRREEAIAKIDQEIGVCTYLAENDIPEHKCLSLHSLYGVSGTLVYEVTEYADMISILSSFEHEELTMFKKNGFAHSFAPTSWCDSLSESYKDEKWEMESYVCPLIVHIDDMRTGFRIATRILDNIYWISVYMQRSPFVATACANRDKRGNLLNYYDRKLQVPASLRFVNGIAEADIQRHYCSSTQKSNWRIYWYAYSDEQISPADILNSYNK